MSSRDLPGVGPRVLHLISSADRRGAQVFASQLVDALGGVPSHHLASIAPATTPHPVSAAVLGSKRSDPAGLLRLVAGLRGFDLLVAHGSSALLHGAFASALARRPFIYRNIGDPTAWGDVTAAQVRIGWPLRRAAAVAALYPGAAEHLGATYRLRPDRVVTIPNAVPDVAPPSPAARRQAATTLGLDPTRTWCGYLGSLSEEKGVLDAIEAVASRSDLGLVVAGAGPLEQAARDLAARHPDTAVVFAGVVDDPMKLLAAVEVIVIPSRTEGLPAVAIEAGLAGLPVVATRVGGVPSIVLDHSTGILVDDTAPSTLGGAIDEAVRRGQEFGTAARAHCETHFTMERVAGQWSELITRTLRAR